MFLFSVSLCCFLFCLRYDYGSGEYGIPLFGLLFRIIKDNLFKAFLLFRCAFPALGYNGLGEFVFEEFSIRGETWFNIEETIVVLIAYTFVAKNGIDVNVIVFVRINQLFVGQSHGNKSAKRN